MDDSARADDRNGRVLLVDDNPAFHAIIVEIAKLSDCTVTWADSLAAARRATAHLAFDLLMIDLALADGSGLDLLDDLDLADQGEVAIVTGNPSIESAVRAVRAPVVEYLIKPVPTDVLVRLMDRARDRAQILPERLFEREAGRMPGDHHRALADGASHQPGPSIASGRTMRS